MGAFTGQLQMGNVLFGYRTQLARYVLTPWAEVHGIYQLADLHHGHHLSHPQDHPGPKEWKEFWQSTPLQNTRVRDNWFAPYRTSPSSNSDWKLPNRTHRVAAGGENTAIRWLSVRVAPDPEGTDSSSLVDVLLFAMRFMMSGGAVTCPIHHTFRQPARGSRLREVQAQIIQVEGTKACETLLLVAHSPADDTEVLKQSN